MNISIHQVRRYLYSHHFYSGMRRAAGTLIPIMVLGGIFGWYQQGLVATFGALCVAFIDQPGPHEHRAREMLGGALLGGVTVTITGLASSHPLLIWFAVIGQCFFFSMLSVYGKKGGLIGFACLLLMTVTMHSPLSADEVWNHTLTSFGGGVFYTAFSYLVSRMMTMREKEQALSIALFATSEYIDRRADMYNLDSDLDTSYRELITCQSDMIETHQAARDMVLRGLTSDTNKKDPRRIMLWNLFVEMIAILDTLVATRTDYALLRKSLEDSDALLFMRDALHKMSQEIERIALAVSRDRPVRRRSSVKAELRALEYEVQLMQENGLATREPDAYRLCVEILRRLRVNARIVDRMAEYTRGSADTQPVHTIELNNSLSEFLSRDQFRVGMLTSNLRLDSPICRYALRISLAAGIAMAVSTLIPVLARQGFWILLTVLIIMKPGFALTRQRNGFRLVGTLIGCALAFAVLLGVHDETLLFVLMVVVSIIGASMIQINYMAASSLNTTAVLLAFHFMDPGSSTVIVDRAMDTFVGSVICFACSYFLPWWESQFMPSLARAALMANRSYLQSGLQYLAARNSAGSNTINPVIARADLNWRLARKNVHIAFSNYASAFYRMILEPESRQQHVAEFNNLLIQSHMLASQIAAVMTTLLAMPHPPASVIEHLTGLVNAFGSLNENHKLEPLPQEIIEHKYPELTYPMKQLQRSVNLAHQELAAVQSTR